MGKFTGKDLYVEFAGQEITADFTEFSEDEEVATVDASAGADVARTYLTTLEDGTATLALKAKTDGTATTDPWQLLDKGATGTLIWAPEGTATGKSKHSVNSIVTNRNRAYPYADLAMMNFSFQFSGVVSDTVY